MYFYFFLSHNFHFASKFAYLANEGQREVCLCVLEREGRIRLRQEQKSRRWFTNKFYALLAFVFNCYFAKCFTMQFSFDFKFQYTKGNEFMLKQRVVH